MENPIYFNTAASGKLSEKSITSIPTLLEKYTKDPGGTFLHWLFNEYPECKKLLGRYIHAEEDLIAFLPNSSFGISSFARAIEGKIQRILLYRNDYPSLNLPFEMGKFKVSYVDHEIDYSISLSHIRKCIQKYKSQILIISDVQFISGYRLHIEKLQIICQQENCLLMVDATQSFGLLNWDVKDTNIDVLISSSYKWIQGGHGSGIMYIKRDVLEAFPSMNPGFGSMKHEGGEWAYTPTIRSYEPGHLNMIGLTLLQSALQERIDKGMENVAHLSFIETARFVELLEKYELPIIGNYNMEHRAGIVCVPMNEKTFIKITEKGILATYRKNMARFSLHHYNHIEEVERAINILRKSY